MTPFVYTLPHVHLFTRERVQNTHIHAYALSCPSSHRSYKKRNLRRESMRRPSNVGVSVCAGTRALSVTQNSSGIDNSSSAAGCGSSGGDNRHSMWSVEMDDGSWKDYEGDVCSALEQAWNRGAVGELDVKINARGYNYTAHIRRHSSANVETSYHEQESDRSVISCES
jgi:hypothetical protein